MFRAHKYVIYMCVYFMCIRLLNQRTNKETYLLGIAEKNIYSYIKSYGN